MIVSNINRSRIDRTLNKVIVNTSALRSCSPAVCVKKCKVITTCLTELFDYTEICAEDVQNKANNTEKDAINTEKEIINLSQQRKRSEKQLRDIEEELCRLNCIEGRLNKEISSIQSEIGSLEKKIKEEQTKREDAAVDWIPFVGLFEGIRTGRYHRMIPFYSTIDGIVSAITNEKEKMEAKNEQKRREKNQTKEMLQKKKQHRSGAQNENSQLETKIHILDEELKEKEEEKKEILKTLTFLRNLLRELKIAIEKQKLLLSDIDTIKMLMDTDVFEGEVNDLICKIKDIEVKFKRFEICSEELPYERGATLRKDIEVKFKRFESCSEELPYKRGATWSICSMM